MEIKAVGSLPDEPPAMLDRPQPQLSNAHHTLEPAHADDVRTYLQEHRAPEPARAVQQPTIPDKLNDIAASPVNADFTRSEGDYVELIGGHENTVHDITHHEAKVSIHAYALLFFSMTVAVLQSVGNVAVLVTCAAMFAIAVGLLMTKRKATALKLLLATLAIELLVFAVYAINPMTRPICFYLAAMAAYTVYTIRDVNDVA